MMAKREIIEKIRVERIKQIYKRADEIAALHNVLTSNRGNYFHLKLLHSIEEFMDFSQINKLRKNARLRESHFHLDKLLAFNLLEIVQEQDEEKYQRTELGKMSINSIRTFESQIGKKAAKEIYKANLGPESIRLFLRIFCQEKEIDFIEKEIKFTAPEIVEFSSFLPRSKERIAAIDKLIDAALLTYDDDLIYLGPAKISSFYKYLLVLNEIITRGKDENKKS